VALEAPTLQDEVPPKDVQAVLKARQSPELVVELEDEQVQVPVDAWARATMVARATAS